MFEANQVSLPSNPSMRLHDYQVRCIDDIIGRPSVALWLEVGLGKSAIALNVLEREHSAGRIFSTLVVAPKKVAEETWPEERKIWTPGLTMTLITGSPKERMRKLMEPTQVHVISRDNLVWLIETLEKKWPYDSLAIDESQGFKDPGSKRFRALKRVVRHHDLTLLMSATPASENLMGLWPQVYIADQGARLGKSFTAYRQAFFESDYMGWKWQLRSSAEGQIHDRLSDLVIAMKAEDYLTLPDKIEIDEVVGLDEREMSEYRRLERDYLLAEHEIVAANAAVLTGKLQQLASGAVYRDDGWVGIHDRKVERLLEIVEEANGSPVLVFYWFKHEKERILRAVKGAEDLDVAKWNRREQKVALAHPQSAGAGLNLQKGGNLIVWMSVPWSLELYTQAIGRLHRQGQQEVVTIKRIVAAGTIDEDIVAALADKKMGQDRLIEALKRRAANV